MPEGVIWDVIIEVRLIIVMDAVAKDFIQTPVSIYWNAFQEVLLSFWRHSTCLDFSGPALLFHEFFLLLDFLILLGSFLSFVGKRGSIDSIVPIHWGVLWEE